MKHDKDILFKEDRGIYDIYDKLDYSDVLEKGLNENIIKAISKSKEEPEWLLQFRLEAFEIFKNSKDSNWGPDLSEINLNDIVLYIKPETKLKRNWEDLPEYLFDTFDRLGIPKAEQESLAGISAQYDSEEVYHNVKEELLEQGIIYLDFDTAVKEHEKLVREYFSKNISPRLHKYAALHYAVFSGGSFVYVPKNTEAIMPIQSYYRLNAPGAGQFEHTLIIVEENSSLHFIEGCSAPKYNELNIHAGAVEIFVKENSHMKFSTIENWSKNMYNLNTKRAILEKNAKIEWVSGSFGSKVSMLYPTSILKGDNSSSTFTSVSFAGEGQNIDNGCTAIHIGKNSSSIVNTKSIVKNGGISTTRNVIRVQEGATGVKSNSDCDSLILDNLSVSDTIPVIDIRENDADVGHEAKIGKIENETIFYLMSRGLNEKEAKAMIVRGFASPISQELPLEYAIEMNNLINLELEGQHGI